MRHKKLPSQYSRQGSLATGRGSGNWARMETVVSGCEERPAALQERHKAFLFWETAFY